MSKAEQKPMTMAEIAQEIQRGNTYPGKVWYCVEPNQTPPAPTIDNDIDRDTAFRNIKIDQGVAP